MSQNFVTESELDKRLELYDRLGEAEKQSGLTEERLKKYLRDNLEQNQVETKNLIEERTDQLYSKIEVHLKKQIDLAVQNIQTSTLETIHSSIEKAKRELEINLANSLKNKSDEIKANVNLSQSNFESNLEKLINVKLKKFEMDYTERKDEFEKIWLESSKHEARNSISILKKEISEQTEAQITATLKEVLTLIETLKADLSLEMSKKLVDKAAIEQKMKDIEFELTKKAQSIIDFNINQARMQMEQSTKAEVQQGIKTVANQIISGLA
jgi:hypothetical protein